MKCNYCNSLITKDNVAMEYNKEWYCSPVCIHKKKVMEIAEKILDNKKFREMFEKLARN